MFDKIFCIVMSFCVGSMCTAFLIQTLSEKESTPTERELVDVYKLVHGKDIDNEEQRARAIMIASKWWHAFNIILGHKYDN